MGGIRGCTQPASMIIGSSTSPGALRDRALVAASSSPMSRTTISPQQSLARRVPRFIPPKLRVRSATTHDECRPLVASSPLGTSSATTLDPPARNPLMVAIPPAIAPRGSPSKPVPSSASMITGTSGSTDSTTRTDFTAASRWAIASADFGAAISITLVSTPARARFRATTQPSPPLFPEPVKTATPCLRRSEYRRSISADAAAPARSMSTREGVPLSMAARSRSADSLAPTTQAGIGAGWRSYACCAQFQG